MRISASSYSNTAPLVWSFLYGRYRGSVELILDNAPARSAELLAAGRVDVALAPVIVYQMIDDLRLVPEVCVGARQRVRSVCLVTREGIELDQVRSVALDTSSKTSVVLTKIIFREFLGSEPEWRDADPNVDAMLAASDAALLIGDPALSAADSDSDSKIGDQKSFDLAELWHRHTGLGFIFAMWMTKRKRLPLDFAAALDEGLERIDEIASNYASHALLTHEQLKIYLTENISYRPDDKMLQGMDLFFRLARKHGLLKDVRPLVYL